MVNCVTLARSDIISYRARHKTGQRSKHFAAGPFVRCDFCRMGCELICLGKSVGSCLNIGIAVLDSWCYSGRFKVLHCAPHVSLGEGLITPGKCVNCAASNPSVRAPVQPTDGAPTQWPSVSSQSAVSGQLSRSRAVQPFWSLTRLLSVSSQQSVAQTATSEWPKISVFCRCFSTRIRDLCKSSKTTIKTAGCWRVELVSVHRFPLDSQFGLNSCELEVTNSIEMDKVQPYFVFAATG